MDLSIITPSNREYEVLHPKTGEPIGLVFTLRPGSAPEVKKFEREWTNQQLRRGRKQLNAEQIEARNMGRIVASVEGWAWNGDASWGGEKLEFKPENLRRVLKEGSFIFTQLDEELGNDEAFFGD